jgi:hypothetical protein
MNPVLRNRGLADLVLFAAALSFTAPGSIALAQSSGPQQKVAAMEAAIYKNTQMLGQYTWQQQETVSVRGDVKKTALYQVQLGPDGKPVKVDISQSQSSDRRKWGIRHRIAQDYIDYGKQVASLAASYTQLQTGRLKQLYSQGNVSLKSGGAPGLDSIVITDYVKPGDSVTVTFNRAQKAVVAIGIASYLSGPSDVVTIAAQFAKLPDGTSHVSTVSINGQSKSMMVQEVNMNYQKRA